MNISSSLLQNAKKYPFHVFLGLKACLKIILFVHESSFMVWYINV